jgi:hypothetical protein
MTDREAQFGTAELDAEHGGGPPNLGRTFPASWGLPVGDRMSEARAKWVRRNVELEVHNQHFQHLADANLRLLWIARSAFLDRVKDCP